MGLHEVTIGQFRQFIQATDYKTEPERDGKGGVPRGSDDKTNVPQVIWASPGLPKVGAPALGDDHPATQITWNDAVAFCQWLSSLLLRGSPASTERRRLARRIVPFFAIHLLECSVADKHV